MALPTVLDRICNRRRQDVAASARERPVEKLKEKIQAASRPVNSLAAAIAAKNTNARRAFIAEIKRASPSAGPIHPNVDVVAQAAAYAAGGATAISVLTEPHEFLGNDADLIAVRAANPKIPILRKDFTVDPYQIWEARALGADVVLLLVNVLGDKLAEFLAVADEAGLEAVVEVHDAAELQLALATPAKLIGINARNLKTFETKLEWVEELLVGMPERCIPIAESGVKTLDDVIRLENAGARAFLVGETLMRSEDPQTMLRQWGAV